MKIHQLPSLSIKPQATRRNRSKVALPPEENNQSPERDQLIATAAYFKAQARGFSPGGELNDWLQSEAELDRQSEE